MSKRFFKRRVYVFINGNLDPVKIIQENKVIYDDPENWSDQKILSFDDLYGRTDKYSSIVSDWGHIPSSNRKRSYRYITIDGKQYKKSNLKEVRLVQSHCYLDLDTYQLHKLLNNITIGQFKEWIKDIANNSDL